LLSELAIRLLSGFMAARYLAVGAEVRLFEALAAGPATLEELALATDMPPRTLRILADALVAAGFLERRADRYINRSLAAGGAAAGASIGASLAVRVGETLSKLLEQGEKARPPASLWRPTTIGPLAVAWRRHYAAYALSSPWRLWREVIFPQWAGLGRALREDTATFLPDELSAEQRRLLVEGIAFLTTAAAESLAKRYPFGRHRRVLDLGGGAGPFLLAALRRHKKLEGTLFELPVVADLARGSLAGDPVGRAALVVEGNFFEDPIPPGHDAIILANVAHLFSPSRNLALLRRIRAASAPGARLLLADFWTDPTRTIPPLAALMAGVFQTITGEGDVYSAEELGRWLAASGWRAIERMPLDGALSVVVAEAA
jgi:hypothetical protein